MKAKDAEFAIDYYVKANRLTRGPVDDAILFVVEDRTNALIGVNRQVYPDLPGLCKKLRDALYGTTCKADWAGPDQGDVQLVKEADTILGLEKDEG